MKRIIKSILNLKDIETELLEDLLSANITDTEKEYIDYILKSKTELSMLPTERAFIDKFPETEVFLEKQDIIAESDLEFAIRELIRDRKAFEAGKQLMNLASQVSTKGLSEDDLEKLRDMIDSDNNVELSKASYSFKEFHKQYEETKDKPTGLLTFVNEIDDMIGGMNYGTVNIIMAYVASFKSVWGVNIVYNNTYKLGYNVALISLEVPREMVQENILCRHSAENKFSQYPFICHNKIRNRTLSDEEEDFIFNTVADDLENNSKGKLFILDETDFVNMTFSEIRNTLYKIDDKCFELTGTGLDAVVVDYAQLFKFTDNGGKGKSEMALVNDYISFFRRLTVKFRKHPTELNSDGTPKYRQLSTVILAQANRQGYEKACKTRGKYTLLALSEANELERSAYRVFSIWTDDLLKESKEAMLCVLKNRGGKTQYEPFSVYADGESYVFGDSDSQNTDTIDLSSTSDEDLLSAFDDTDFGLY